MQSSFKYQFPLKHVKLNSLPRELYPQPMRKYNYDVKEIRNLQQDIQDTSYHSLANHSSSNMDLLRAQRVKRRAISEHKSKYNNYNKRVQTVPNKRLQRKQDGRFSPKAEIASKTEKLCRIQSAYSEETKNLIFQGNSIQLNLHEPNIIIRSEDENTNQIRAFKQKEPNYPSLNDQTLKYLSDSKVFQQRKQNTESHIKQKLFYYYANLLQDKNTPFEEFIRNQVEKFSKYVELDPEFFMSNEEKKLASIKRNRHTTVGRQRSSFDSSDRLSTYDQPNVQKEKSRIQKSMGKSMENENLMRKARELKTVEHHKLISRLNQKTTHLFNQWQQFQDYENDFMNVKKLKQKQFKLLQNYKDMNREMQSRLQTEFNNIQKMVLNSDG